MDSTTNPHRLLLPLSGVPLVTVKPAVTHHRSLGNRIDSKDYAGRGWLEVLNNLGPRCLLDSKNPLVESRRKLDRILFQRRLAFVDW